jgi:hypothetical protein
MKQRNIILIVLATAAALAITVIGVAYASYLNYNNSYQANTGTNTPYATAPRNDFWGWLGGCFGWGNNQPYTGYQYQAPSNSTAQPPQTYAPQPNPNQGYYPYGTPRGCRGW